MTRIDDALRDLLDGVPWEILTKKYPKSTLYEALRRYYPKAEVDYIELKEKNQNLRKQVEQLETVKKEKEDQEKGLNEEMKQAEERLEGLKRKVDGLNAEAKVAEEKLIERQRLLHELEDRGLSEEFLAFVIDSDIKSEEDFLSRIETKQHYEALKQEIKDFEEKIGVLKDACIHERQRLEETKKELHYEKNSLDEIRSTNALWLDALEVSVKAYELGYTSDIQKGLLDALMRLGIKDQPIRSARRLLRKLELLEEEVELDKAIRRKNVELETLKGEYDDLKATIETLQHNCCNVMRNIEESGEQQIERTTDHCIAAVKQTEYVSTSAITRTEEEAQKTLEQIERRISGFFIQQHLTMSAAIDRYSDDLAKWGDMREEMGKYLDLQYVTNTLLGMKQDTEAIVKLKPSIITRIAEGLHIYVSRKYPGAKTSCPKDIAAREIWLAEWYEIGVQSLTRWLLDVFNEQERWQ